MIYDADKLDPFLDLTKLTGGGREDYIECRWCKARVKATYLRRHAKTKGCIRAQRQRDASRLMDEAIELNYQSFVSRRIACLFRLLNVHVIEVPPNPRRQYDGSRYWGPEWAVSLALQADEALGYGGDHIIERLIRHARDNEEFRNTIVSLIRMSGTESLQAYALSGSVLCSKGAVCDAERLVVDNQIGEYQAGICSTDDGCRNWIEDWRIKCDGITVGGPS